MKTRKNPRIIAHRGASGYLPEHTLAAKAMAYGMGADYLEQDLIATRDDAVIVNHDLHLDRVTDVRARFPGRARADGRYYARDFDLAEIRGLTVTARVGADGQPVFPGRFPAGSGTLRVHTLAEELEFVAGMNAASGRTVGVYPEIKAPAWHRSEGVDLSALTLEILAGFGYRDRNAPCFIQCFDWRETRRLRETLGTDLKLVQLLADPRWGESDTDYAALLRGNGIAEMAGVVDGVGPWLQQLYRVEPAGGCLPAGDFVALAQEAGLEVHPYTFREDALPPGFSDFESLLRFFVADLAVDGLFTDFPDLAAVCTRCHRQRRKL